MKDGLYEARLRELVLGEWAEMLLWLREQFDILVPEVVEHERKSPAFMQTGFLDRGFLSDAIRHALLGVVKSDDFRRFPATRHDIPRYGLEVVAPHGKYAVRLGEAVPSELKKRGVAQHKRPFRMQPSLHPQRRANMLLEWSFSGPVAQGMSLILPRGWNQSKRSMEKYWKVDVPHPLDARAGNIDAWPVWEAPAMIDRNEELFNIQPAFEGMPVAAVDDDLHGVLAPSVDDEDVTEEGETGDTSL